MVKVTNILFIQPNAAKEIYQDLSQRYSAIEPPIWAALLANAVRAKGFNPEIMDCEALNMTDDDAIYHISNMKPRIIAFVVYGQQPSASSQNMEGAIRLATKIQKARLDTVILFVGGHVAALPKETLALDCVDFVCQNEGVYTIIDLLSMKDINSINELKTIKGLGFKGDFDDDKKLILNPPAEQVPSEKLETDLPGMAWDLLPMKHYRTALWHALSNNAERQPFAALYTSLNCPFGCSFCCISSPFGGSGFKYWKPEFMIEEFKRIHDMGITNIKIADEMFVMRPDHFMRLCELIIERGYKFNIWAYARVDITKPEYLATLKRAGVNWLALGIESGNKAVRKDVIKGRFEDINIRDIVRIIRDSGINVMGNYIFGLPEDTHETMKQTLDLALELNTEAANFYSAMAYPGSKLHNIAKQTGWKLPETHAGYSQHSYVTQPLPTKYLTAEEVLKFRDHAWLTYHTNPDYLTMIEDKFGDRAADEIVASTNVKLKRKILGD